LIQLTALTSGAERSRFHAVKITCRRADGTWPARRHSMSVGYIVSMAVSPLPRASGSVVVADAVRVRQ